MPSLSCCVYKRPFDAVFPWTCPVCGTTERRRTPEEDRRGWAFIRQLATGWTDERETELALEILASNIATAAALCEAHELGVQGSEDPSAWHPGCGRSAGEEG